MVRQDTERKTSDKCLTRRCTRAGDNVGFEVNVKRARRVNLVVRPKTLNEHN